MDQQNADLMKAGMKSLASHFKKASAHHEKMADHHENMHKAHLAHADHHESMMGKAEDSHHAHHKASAAFHKTMAAHHEKLHKAHKAHAAHHASMHEAMSAEEAKKVLKLAGLEDQILNTPTTPVSTPAAGAAPTAATSEPTAPAPALANLNETVNKALETKLNEAVNAGLERVLASDQFNKKVDEAISNALLGKLGQTTVPTSVATFPVARPGETQQQPSAPVAVIAGKSVVTADLSKVDQELQDLVSMG